MSRYRLWQTSVCLFFFQIYSSECARNEVALYLWESFGKRRQPFEAVKDGKRSVPVHRDCDVGRTFRDVFALAQRTYFFVGYNIRPGGRSAPEQTMGRIRRTRSRISFFKCNRTYRRRRCFRKTEKNNNSRRFSAGKRTGRRYSLGPVPLNLFLIFLFARSRVIITCARIGSILTIFE